MASKPPTPHVDALCALLIIACAALAAAPDALARSPAAPTPIVAQSAPDGAVLYTQHCSGCHADEKKGQSAVATKKAIDEDMGKMGSLKFLTSAELAAIAAAR
jgi:mono/diheme cytochrome c family protein